jgi:hypothetical protein
MDRPDILGYLDLPKLAAGLANESDKINILT